MPTFKSIQLVGFKSFADKTTIPLNDGVTCIVGPNGCGKSNVADAIRWVLGEQSAKMMRGSQMMDVVFNGTEKRRPMSFCEVTLTFDNTKRIFDVDFDEVEMTRRLYRDGTSEYILNKEPSRMKVLTGLLHGAGAAKEGYSIIGQGRIEQIMNAKPEDRRSIFEEATGIVVFKDRKAEVERKIAASKDNLYLFMQRLQERERILPSLKRAADNAIKYRELYQKVQSLEMNLYIYRYERAEGAKAVLYSQNEALAGAISELDAKATGLQEEYVGCRDTLTRNDGELQDLNDRIRRYEVGIERKSGESKLYTEKALAVKAQLSAAQEELVYSANRIDDIDKELKRAEAVAAKNEQRIASMGKTADELRAKIDDYTQKISEYEYLTGEHRKKVLDAFKDLSEIRENMGSLSAQKELLRERLGELEADMEKVRAKRDATREEYNACIQKSNAVANLLAEEDRMTEEAEKALAEVTNKLQLITKQIFDAQAGIQSVNSALDTYRALHDRFEGYVESVKRMMRISLTDTEISSRIKGLIADVVSCDKEYEIAIETAFGGAMQNIITATREDAQYLIEYARRNRTGVITCLPIDAMKPRFESGDIRSAVRDRGAIGFAIDLVRYDKKFENIIHNLLGNTLIVDTIDNGRLIAKRYPRAFKIVTLSGDIFSQTGSMTGGDRRGIAGNLLANERRIKELEESLESKKSFLQRAEKRQTELEAEVDRAEHDAENLQNKFRDYRVELAQLTEKQSALMQAVNNASSEYSAYGQSVAALRDRLQGLDSEYSGVSKGADDLTAKSDDASAKMDDMSAEYDGLIAEREKLTEKLNNILVETASLQTLIRTGGENVTRLNGEREKLTAKIAEINAGIPEIKKQIEELRIQAERTALTAEEQVVVNDLRNKIAAINSAKVTLNERIKQIDLERFECAENREKLVEKQHSIELEVIKIETELENSRQRIAEEYNTDYEGCLPYKVEDFNPVGVISNIASLRKQMSTIGGFNEDAISEYETSLATYNAMLVEREDLEKALADLQTALDDIRAEMLRKFDEGFAKISENFKRTFKELFGGGKAELQLDYTECDDPLNAGVEIIACPPGKKLTKISLLSGGERALTAIAILFAIIAMRPMPFCVLDEIEAALDEANVARYAKYLKKFAQDTQFIVITHRKPTMENADVLFGVTMEEKGVSKIVSVKLSEVETKLGGDSVM